jgi:hypothetical protein
MRKITMAAALLAALLLLPPALASADSGDRDKTIRFVNNNRHRQIERSQNTAKDPDSVTFVNRESRKRNLGHGPNSGPGGNYRQNYGDNFRSGGGPVQPRKPKSSWWGNQPAYAD